MERSKTIRRKMTTGELFDAGDVSVGIELSFEARVVHIAYGAKNRASAPGPIVQTKAPGDARIAIGIPTIQFIFVIKGQRRAIGVLDRA